MVVDFLALDLVLLVDFFLEAVFLAVALFLVALAADFLAVVLFLVDFLAEEALFLMVFLVAVLFLELDLAAREVRGVPTLETVKFSLNPIQILN